MWVPKKGGILENILQTINLLEGLGKGGGREDTADCLCSQRSKGIPSLK